MSQHFDPRVPVSWTSTKGGAPRVRVSSWYSLAGKALLLILASWATPAFGDTCDIVMSMATVQVPDNIIITTMKDSMLRFTPADLACLRSRGATPAVLAQAEALPSPAPPAQAQVSASQNQQPHTASNGGVGGGPTIPTTVPVPKYDCLADICLNTRSGPVPRAAVTVSDRKWTREVEICSGRVTSVVIKTGWHQTYFQWRDLLQGTSTPVSDDNYATGSDLVLHRVVTALDNKGWILVREDQPSSTIVLRHPGVHGLRLTGTSTVQNDLGTGWVLVVMSAHPLRTELCRAKNEEGL